VRGGEEEMNKRDSVRKKASEGKQGFLMIKRLVPVPVLPAKVVRAEKFKPGREVRLDWSRVAVK